MSLYITVVCDSCEAELKTDSFGIHTAEEFARNKGWDAGLRQKDYCEKCKPHVFKSLRAASQEGTEAE